MYPYNIPIDMETNVQEKGKPKRPHIPDKKILELILGAMEAAACNARYYKKLAGAMPSPEDVEAIRHMELDEKKHEKLFADIYYFLAGERPATQAVKDKELYPDAIIDFQHCMFDELKEVELNRIIYFSFLNMAMRDMLYEIMTDKQAHAIKFGYLFAKYKNFSG